MKAKDLKVGMRVTRPTLYDHNEKVREVITESSLKKYAHPAYKDVEFTVSSKRESIKNAGKKSRGKFVKVYCGANGIRVGNAELKENAKDHERFSNCVLVGVLQLDMVEGELLVISETR